MWYTFYQVFIKYHPPLSGNSGTKPDRKEETMKVSRIGYLMVGLLAVCPAVGNAMPSEAGAKYTLSMTKNYTPSEWTQKVEYTDRVGHKLLYGGKNTLFGFMELYNEPRDAMREKSGFLKGLGKGVINMVGDTLGGAIHLITFPITEVDVTLPEGGTDVL